METASQTSPLPRSLWAAPFAAAFALLLGGAPTRAEDPPHDSWPQWRGPTRDGLVAAGPAWPANLSGLTRRWRVELGPGYSGPIAWRGVVFVTETVDAADEVVRALDRASGRELWRARWQGALSVPFFAKKNGDWIRATPACDGESLFVAGMRDVLVCLDAQTGVERWRVDFPASAASPLPAFGFVCSPLVLGEAVYVQAGGAFAKLNKRTGEAIWTTLKDGGGMESAFSSPIAATLLGVPQIVVQMRQKLAGVAPDSGQVLWSQTVPSFRGMNILTPTVFGNSVFTSSYRNRSFLYEIEKREQGMAVAERWSLAAQGYMSSPVVIDGHAYLHLGNGRLCCIDLTAGRELWRTQPFGEYWSMVASADRILALDQRGELLLIQASPKGFELLDRREAATAESWAHLAVCGGDVFVRDLRGVSAYEWK